MIPSKTNRTTSSSRKERRLAALTGHTSAVAFSYGRQVELLDGANLKRTLFEYTKKLAKMIKTILEKNGSANRSFMRRLAAPS